MKIDRIEINNFLGIRRAAFDLTAPVSVFAGGNACGKTTICDAVRYALTGNPGRVDKKKDYGQLISHGAAKGDVTVTVTPQPGIAPAVFMRDVGTGKGAGPKMEDPRIAYVIDAHRFATMSQADKSTFVFDLFGTGAAGQEVFERLAKRGVDEDLIEQLKTPLRIGFDTALEEAKVGESMCKSTWRTITGEAYGSVKAETWQKQKPDQDAALAEGHTRELERDLNNALSHMSVLDQQIAQLREAQAAQDALAAVRAEGELLDQRLSEMGDQRSKLNKLVEQRNNAERDLNGIRASHQPNSWPCPCCGEYLAFDGHTLIKGAKPEPMSDEVRARMTGLRELLAQIKKQISITESAVLRCESEVAASRRAIEQQQSAGVAQPIEPAAMEQLSTKRGEAAQTIESLRARMKAAAEYDAAVNDAENRTRQAAKAHADTKRWAQAVAALRHDGIPRDLIEEATGRINERMQTTAAAAHWSPAKLAPDMSISVDGRDYRLLSGSERWRADLQIAEAVAHFAGLGLMVIDHLDILDPGHRIKAMKLFDSLSKEYQSILVMGTFKAAPSIPMQSVEVFWIGDSEAAGTAA